MGASHSSDSGGGFFSAIHNVSASMGAGNPLVQGIYGTSSPQLSSSSQSSSSSTSSPPSNYGSNYMEGGMRRALVQQQSVGSKRPAPPAEEEPPARIQRPPPESIDVNAPASQQPVMSYNDLKKSPDASYQELKNIGAQDSFNTPESVASAQYKLSSLLNLLPTDYTNSSEFVQFRNNLNFLTNRNLLSQHELNTWMQTLQQSSDPIEDFIQPEETDQIQQQVVRNPSLLFQLSLHPQQLIQWMHEPLSPLSFAIMAMGTLEHSEWTSDRKQKALQAMSSEASSNPVMKQGLQWVSQALQSSQGKINPSQRPSYQPLPRPVNDAEGGGGVHQKGDLMKGTGDILEGYASYKTGSGLGQYARKAEQYIQGEGAVSEIIGIENAQKLAGGISSLAPAAERLGEVGAVIGIAEGVNEVTTALGITKENYIGEGISWVTDKVEDGFQNFISGVKHLFS